MSKLEELIAELESADDGSRKLDWTIADYLGDIPEHRILAVGWDYDWYRNSESDYALWKATDSEGRSSQLWQAPQVTSSLDAAVALVNRVLPGAQISLFIGHLTAAKDGSGSRAQVMRGKGPKCPDTGIRWPKLHGECFHAPTPALALCVAVLRAKLAQEEA